MKAIFTVAVAVFALGTASQALAQADSTAQTKALADCLAAKSTGSDRIGFAGWMVAALASAPQLNGIAQVDANKREDVDRSLARIFTRLISIDCANEAKPLLKAKDQSGFGAAFEVLGRLAMQELTGNAEASKAMGKFTEYLNEADFEAMKK